MSPRELHCFYVLFLFPIVNTFVFNYVFIWGKEKEEKSPLWHFGGICHHIITHFFLSIAKCQATKDEGQKAAKGQLLLLFEGRHFTAAKAHTHTPLLPERAIDCALVVVTHTQRHRQSHHHLTETVGSQSAAAANWYLNSAYYPTHCSAHSQEGSGSERNIARFGWLCSLSLPYFTFVDKCQGAPNSLSWRLLQKWCFVLLFVLYVFYL